MAFVRREGGSVGGSTLSPLTPLLSLLDWKGEEDGRSGGGHWTSVVARIILFSPMKKKRPFPGIRVYLSPEENYRGRVLSIYSREGGKRSLLN